MKAKEFAEKAISKTFTSQIHGELDWEIYEAELAQLFQAAIDQPVEWMPEGWKPTEEGLYWCQRKSSYPIFHFEIKTGVKERLEVWVNGTYIGLLETYKGRFSERIKLPEGSE